MNEPGPGTYNSSIDFIKPKSQFAFIKKGKYYNKN